MDRPIRKVLGCLTGLFVVAGFPACKEAPVPAPVSNPSPTPSRASAVTSAEAEDFLYLFLHPSIEKNRFTFEPQLRLAEEADVHKFTFYSSAFPFLENPPAEAWKKTDDLFALFSAQSDTARVAPRIALLANVGDGGLSAEHGMRWTGATTSFLCWASPSVQDVAERSVRAIVEHYEASPYGERIWAYQISALETGEWIPLGYRTHGADYSPTNTQAFRQWLFNKYPSDAALQEAWGDPGLTRSGAAIPADVDKRFPIRPTESHSLVQAFYELPREQNWVDYSEFVSDTTVRTISRLAAQVKESSQNRKKVITFYGYIFELPGSMCGHLRMEQLLRDPHIDLVAAPISYAPYSQRLAGGVGGAMSAVDSLPLHQKTWVNEDDIRTHAQDKAAFVPKWYWDPSNPEYRVPKSLQETTGVLRRNLASAAFHEGATWWMDLYGGGWYSDPGIWEIWKGDFGRSLREMRRTSLTFRSTVAVIVDEESRLYEKFTWTCREIYPSLRNSLMGSGAPVAFYYLGDYLDGKVPATSATVFANLWRVTPEIKTRLAQRIRERGGTVIWQYAPGFLVPGGVEGIVELTGFPVSTDSGAVGSSGEGPLDGVKFGGRNRLTPRIMIEDPAATVISRYDSDGSVSGAFKDVDGIRQVLVADYNWNAEMAFRLLSALDIPVLTDRPALVQANDDMLFVYALRDGALNLRAPSNSTFEDGSTSHSLTLKKNESRLIPLRKPEATTTAILPSHGAGNGR